MSLSKDQIRKSESKRVHHVATPEWGGEVCIRQLLGRELTEATNIIEGRSKGDGTEGDNMARLCILYISDEDGNRLLDESDIPMLLDKPMAPLLRCMTIGMHVNGMSNEAQERMKAELDKDPFAVIGSDLPESDAAQSPKRKKQRPSKSSSNG